MLRKTLSAFIAYILISFASASAYAALTVDVNFSDPTLQTALGGDYANDGGVIATEVYNQIAKYSNVPELARGFCNANNYSSHASTLRGYQGYSLFAISVGSMVAVQAPSDDPEFYANLQDELDDGDVYAGVGINPVVAQAGLSLGFIADGLYISFLFGKLHTKIEQGDFRIDHNANIIGGHLGYSIFSEKSILARSLLWRGLSVQAGFIYTDNRFKYYHKLDKIPGSQSVSGVTLTYEIDPSVNFELDTTGGIIPVELYTSIRLLWFLNIGVGAGFDYAYSSHADLRLSSAGDAVITDDGVGGISGYVGQTGKITVDAATEGVKGDRYRPKYMANVGIGLGPLFVDIPLTYYLDNGYAVGVTAGFVW